MIDVTLFKSCGDYIKDIKEGKIASCVYIKKAIERFESTVNREDIEFHDAEVVRAIKFISLFKNPNGTPLTLCGWQRFWLANIVGVYSKTNKSRLYSRSYLEVARGSGKSTLMAAVAMYFMIADGEAMADCFIVANSAKQSAETYRKVVAFSKMIDPKQRMIRACRDNIKFKKTDSKLFSLASDPSKLDGYNCYFGIVDEYHDAPNSLCYEALTRSQVKRLGNSHVAIITTAGRTKECPCYEMRKTAETVLMGEAIDESFFALLFTIDEGDDHHDPKVWEKANPSLNVASSPVQFKKLVDSADAKPSELIGLLTKNFDVWPDKVSRWIPENFLKTCYHQLLWEDFVGKSVYVGIDLSSTFDLTAVTFSFQEDGIIKSKTLYYLPQTALENGENTGIYDKWNQRGYLTLTDSNSVDRQRVLADINNLRKKGLNIAKIYLDQWMSKDLAIDLYNLGFDAENYSQCAGNFCAPTRRLEELLANNAIWIDSNPINDFCIRNVVLYTDHNGNIKPDKEKSVNKIDGVITLIQSIAAIMYNPTLIY